MDRVLVLGATGFIGQHLIDRLCENKTVIGYDRVMGNLPCPMIEAEFSAEQGFEALLEEYRIDTVYHLISTTIPKEDTSDIVQEVSENVLPTLRLLEAMRKRPGTRLVFVSSGGTVYGESKGHANRETDSREPICGYGMQKLTIEQYIQFYNRRYGTDFRIARLSNPYGVPPRRPRGQGVIPILMGRLLAGEPIALFGDTLRDYIHIDDAVEALVRFGDYEGDLKLLNIGSGVPVRLSTLVRQIEALTGMRFSRVDRQDIRRCDVAESVLDITQASRALNWIPSVGLEEGIQRTWRELREKGTMQKG